MQRIIADPVALCLWLTAVPVGVLAMYAVDDARVFIIAWAAAGLAAAVLAHARAGRAG